MDINQDEEASIASDDSIIQKLFQIRQEQQGLTKTTRIPFYLKDTLPDKKFSSAKAMAAKIPNSVDRPSAE